MTNKIRVKPNRDVVPPHPIDGPLLSEGGYWTADQYTFRLIRDGDIVEIAEPVDAPEAKPRSRRSARAGTESASE